MSANEFKKGRYSKKEDNILRESIDSTSWAGLSKMLNRSEESLQERCTQLGIHKKTVTNSLDGQEFSLRGRAYFSELTKQFTDSELDLFEYHWNRIISQFSGDVLPTEETQILDVIKLEIIMNRNAVQQKVLLEQMRVTDSEITGVRHSANASPDLILALETQLAALASGHGAIVKEYRELQEKKDKMLKSIRGDRAERVSAATGRMNFVSLIKELVGNPDLRKKIGLEMEKRRLAMQKAKKELSEYHTFVDGTVDQPLLTVETLKPDNDTLYIMGEET